MRLELPFASLVVFDLEMPWIVKVENEDGSVADVLAADLAASRSVIDAYRSSNRKAWIVDAEGREVDEGSGAPKAAAT